MKKNSWIKLAGFALAASLVFTGCGSGSGDDGGGQEAAGVGVAAGGGGVAGGGAAGGAAAGIGGGLTGSTFSPGTAGGGGSSTTSGGGAATTTTAGATTTTTTTTAGGANQFLVNLTPFDFRSALNNPTAAISEDINGGPETFILDGFQLGSNNGRLLRIDRDLGNVGADGFAIQDVQVAVGSNVANTFRLTSPFDMVTDGTNIYITNGFNSLGQGSIIRISNITTANGVTTAQFDNLTTVGDIPVNPAFIELVNTTNGLFVYWTEYANSQGGGVLRRVSATGIGNTPEIVVNNLNFPAGIAQDGTNMVLCEAGGGAIGRVISFPVAPATLPLNAGNVGDVTEITNVATEGAISRPFDVVFDGANGFFFTEGMAIPGQALAALGQNNGAVRFLASNATQATVVNSGLDNAAGIDAVDSNNDGTVAVVFSESLDTNGSIQRRLVDINNITQTAPTAVEIGLFSPLQVDIFNEATPEISGIINFDGGQGNGVFRTYGP